MKNLDLEFTRAKDILAAGKKITIISHKGPDGDTIGANLALRLALKHQWQKEVVSTCIDPVPEAFNFLAELDSFVLDFDQASADAIVIVDAGAHYMTNFHKTKPGLFSGKPPVINIDHHSSNDRFGQVNIVEDTAASATQILFHFLNFCGFKIDRKIATCLLNGLYFDTGSFMHSNTTKEVLETAARLLWKGADFKTISKRQFRTTTIPQLKLYGKILERSRVNSKKLTISTVSEQDFSQTGAPQDAASGAIDYLNSIPEGNFACLLHEDGKGLLKGSFRTRTDIDVAAVARFFGGGGHKKASGFSIPGSRLIEADRKIKIGST